jgi:hypothetical protein
VRACYSDIPADIQAQIRYGLYLEEALRFNNTGTFVYKEPSRAEVNTTKSFVAFVLASETYDAPVNFVVQAEGLTRCVPS